MKKYVYILILATLLQFSAFSQPYTELSTLKFQKYSSDKNETNEYSTAVFIPIATKENNYLILGAGYNRLSLKNSLNKPIETLCFLGLFSFFSLVSFSSLAN